MSVFIPHIYESLFVEVELLPNKLIIVGVIYRPNTQPKADLDIFSTTFLDTMDLINYENKTSVIIGDMNIDLLKYGHHGKTNNFIDSVFSRGFMPKIHKPTRITPSSATLIDHIYSNDITNLRNQTAGIIITDVADHFGIFYSFKHKTRKFIEKPNKRRIISDHNIAKFKQLLQNIDFNEILQTDCPDEAFNKFLEIYKQTFELAFPLKLFRPNKKCIKRDRWVTTELLAQLRAKSKLFQKKIKDPTPTNIANYKACRNNYNKQKRATKANYFRDILAEHKTWTILK